MFADLSNENNPIVVVEGIETLESEKHPSKADSPILLTDSGIEIVTSTGEELLKHFKPLSFDFIYSFNALDHAQNPVTCIENALTILRPGGQFALQISENE